MPRLTESEISNRLGGIGKWTRTDDQLTRTYQFPDFPTAIRFVDAIAVAAESAWHHPDIDIRWNKVELKLTTHDEGGLTEKDFDLAIQFDRIAEQR